MEEEKGLSHVAYFRTDGGSCKLYTEEYVKSLQEALHINHQIIDMYVERIDKVVEDLKGTLKINRHYIEETKYGKNEWICMDIDHIQELIDTLEEVKENE